MTEEEKSSIAEARQRLVEIKEKLFETANDDAKIIIEEVLAHITDEDIVAEYSKHNTKESE